LISRPPGATPARDPLALVEQAAVAEEILAVLRHGLGNRFGTIRNAAFFVRRRVARTTAEEDPRVDRFLQTIDDEVVAAHALVEEGAAQAHLAPRQVGCTCAAACARDAASLARVADLGTRFEVAVEPGDVDADPGELTLAIRCLVENAAEAMPEGGVVAVRAAPEGSRFLVEVSDQGPGIPPDDHLQVLRAFYTTKPGHAGLGLAIARRVARNAEGELRIVPRARGTSVVLSFPLSGAAAGPSV